MEHDTRGGIRMDSRYVSWERLDHFDGVLVRVHMLSEGVRGDFGSISNPAVGALYHHVTHLLVCDSPDGQQHVCSAKFVAVAGVARHLNPFI